MTKTRPVVSTKQMIPSIRHQGYHITYALAELIDNSIQAEAKNIEIICLDKLNTDTNTNQLQSIAVYDDGNGMSKEELWDSIRLGESQNRGKEGIGKFGVGLTHASFSQCQKVDVYSWKKPDQIFHVHLDISSESVDATEELVVSEPILESIPERWKKALGHMSKSGSFVIWSKLDRVRWKKATTVIKHSKFMIGRTYRKFIDQDKLKIHMISFDDSSHRIDNNEIILANDPLYLISPSATPAPWDKKPMFQKDGDRWEDTIKIKGPDGKEYDVITRYSFVKNEARVEKRNAGNEPHGKHAANNLGVSIIRANRELTMDTNLITSYDPMERWWGAEIEFPPALDAIFGVSSNKQTASELIDMMKLIGKQNRDLQTSIDLEGEVDTPLYELVSCMSTRIRGLRESVARQKPKPPQPPKPPKPDGGDLKIPVFKNTVTEEQIKKMTDEERLKILRDVLKNMGINEQGYLSLDQELRFEQVPLSGNQFFDVSLVSGVIVITINTEHEAYTSLMGLLLDPEQRESISPDTLLERSAKGFKIFLASWASLENSIQNPTERKGLADIRYNWGVMLGKYFEVNSEKSA